MRCPLCGLENPDTAQVCNCGHQFVPGAAAPDAKPQNLVQCRKCNTSNFAANKFCYKCGATLGTPKRKGASPAFIGCLVLLVPVLVLVIFVGNKSDKSFNATKARLTDPTPTTTPPVTEATKQPIPDAPVPQVPFKSSDPKVCLEILKKSGSYDEYSTTITGAIKNNCGKKFTYVQITFKLTDGSGAVLGTALANVNNLEDGETWKFKAHGFTPSEKYRLDDITAF